MKWIFGACAVAVVAGLLATLAIPAQTITPDEATLKLFPPEIQGVAAIDAAGLRNASLIQEIIQKQPFPAEAQQFFDTTGFQPLRDVDKASLALGGANRLLLIAEARYDRAKVDQYFQNNNVPTETYLGRVVYLPDPQQAFGVTFVDRLILAGERSMLKQAIDRLAAPASNATDNAVLMDMIRKIETGNQVWFVGQTLNMPAGLPVPAPPEVRDVLRSLVSGSYQMRITQDVRVKAIGNFSDSDSARTSADLLRGLVALARTQTAQQPDVLHLLDGVRIDNAGSSMSIQIDAPGDLLKNLQPRRLAELGR